MKSICRDLQSHVFLPSQSGSSSVSELKEKACPLKDEERTAHCSCFLMPRVVTSPGVLLPAYPSLSFHFSLIFPICFELRKREITQIFNQGKRNLIFENRYKQTLYQNIVLKCQHLYEKGFNLTNHQGTTSQNHNEISPHTC